MSSLTDEGARGIRPPFAFWPARARGWAFFTVLLLTLFVGLGLRQYDAALRTEMAPQGIVSYELARTTPAAEAILESWWEDATDDAWGSLILDYPFLFFYSATLMFGCAMAAGAWGRVRPGLVAPLALVAWAQPLAALLDAIENAALAWMLYANDASQPWPLVAWAAAVPKFIIVLVGILVTLSGIVPWATNRRTPRESDTD